MIAYFFRQRCRMKVLWLKFYAMNSVYKSMSKTTLMNDLLPQSVEYNEFAQLLNYTCKTWGRRTKFHAILLHTLQSYYIFIISSSLVKNWLIMGIVMNTRSVYKRAKVIRIHYWQSDYKRTKEKRKSYIFLSCF